MIKRAILLFYLLLTIPGILLAQHVQLDSIRWITKDLGHLYFANGTAYFNFVGKAQSKNHYRIVNDTLIMSDFYMSSAENFKVKHQTNYKFLIRNLTANRLYIKAIEPNAIKLAGNLTYEFTNFKNSYDKDVKVSKIRFLSSSCRDGCPQLSVEIWANGNYYLKGGEHTEPYQGEYIGKLSVPQQDSLNYLFKHSELKKMYNWQQQEREPNAPDYYFEVNFEDSKKDLSITTNSPPLNIIDLVDFMLASYKKVRLAPVK